MVLHNIFGCWRIWAWLECCISLTPYRLPSQCNLHGWVLCQLAWRARKSFECILCIWAICRQHSLASHTHCDFRGSGMWFSEHQRLNPSFLPHPPPPLLFYMWQCCEYWKEWVVNSETIIKLALSTQSYNTLICFTTNPSFLSSH